MAVKYFQTFRPSSEYETAAAEAQRCNALADMLQQQAYQPIEMSNAAPVSYTQGLAKMLQAYLAGKESRKAREAEQKATAAIEKDIAGVERTGQQLRESLESGRKPLTAAETTPDASGLAMVRGPLDPVRLASTKYGREALVTDPELLEAYKTARTKPKMPMLSAEQIMTLDPESRRAVQTAIQSGQDVDYGALKPRKTITKEVDFGNRVLVQYSDGTTEEKPKGIAPSREPSELYRVMGPDGKPVYTTRGEAIGKTAYEKPTELTGDDKVDRRKYREGALGLQGAMDAITGFATKLASIPKEESLIGQKAGELSSAYKLALGAVRELQATGVLNPGEIPFLEDTLKDPQKLAQIINPQSRGTITGQINTISDLLQKKKLRLDETYGYDRRPLQVPEGFGAPKGLPPGAVPDRRR